MNVTRVEQMSELRSVEEVFARYQMDGPHVTAVCDIPMPGDVHAQRATVISATLTELERLGAQPPAIANVERVLLSLEARGEGALVTANAESGAFHWLSPEAVPKQRLTIGPLPALLPVLVELQRTGLVLGALIDRVGADLFLADRGRVDRAGVVMGDDEGVVRGAPGASSPRRFTHRAEAALDANAEEIVTALVAKASGAHVRAVVLSGDDRMVKRVLALLGSTQLGRAKMPVCQVKAGGRHEPNAPDRLGHAAIEALKAACIEESMTLIDRLTEELGQHDKAVVGIEGVWTAVSNGRAKAVVISDIAPYRLELEEITKAALAKRTELIILTESEPTIALDGVAALLRY